MYCWMNSGDIVGSIHGLLHKFIPYWNNALCTVLQSKRGKLLKFFKLYSKVLLSFYLHIETIYIIVICM